MSRSTAAETIKDDLQVLVGDVRDVVVPAIGSAVHTVAEKAPPAMEKGRALAAQKGAEWSEALATRVPDDVADRLPDAVTDRLPAPRRRRGRKLLVLGALAAAGAAAAVLSKRGRHGSGAAISTSAPTPYPRAVSEEANGVVPPTDAPVAEGPRDGIG